MLEAGSVVGGKYRLVAQIGEGGMGVVFRATHEQLGHDVAVKFLTHIAANTPSLVARFLDEARTAVSVRHRNVVQIVDFGVAEDDRPFMVMEFLEGESLADRLGRKPPLSIGETTQTIGLTLSGLGAVHDRGIVHRDLKPENIFLTYDADGFFPKILDFGVSKDLERELEGGRNVRTRDGVLLGTPQYMSPEQARGLRDIDRRSDIYSMGVILYELLTGVSPFDSENVGDILMKVMSSDYPRLERIRSDLPKPLVDVVERAMALDREERFPDAREMRNALFAAVATSSPNAFGITDPSGALNAELASAVVAALARAGTTGESSVATRLPSAPAATPPEPMRARTPATSIDSTTKFRTDTDDSRSAKPSDTSPDAQRAKTLAVPPPTDPAQKDAPSGDPTGLLATPRVTTELKQERSVPVVAIGLSFSVLIGIAAVELRSPGTLVRAFDSVFQSGQGMDTSIPDAGPAVVDAGVDGGMITVRIRPVPDNAVVTIGARSYQPDEVAALRSPNGLLSITLPRADEDVDVKVEVPGFEPFEDRRSMRNNMSFRLRLHSLDAGMDAGIDAGVAATERVGNRPRPRRRGR